MKKWLGKEFVTYSVFRVENVRSRGIINNNNVLQLPSQSAEVLHVHNRKRRKEERDVVKNTTYKARDAEWARCSEWARYSEWATSSEKAPLIRLWAAHIQVAPSLNRWLTPCPYSLALYYQHTWIKMIIGIKQRGPAVPRGVSARGQ